LPTPPCPGGRPTPYALADRDRQEVVYAAALLVVMPRSWKRVCMPMRRVSSSRSMAVQCAGCGRAGGCVCDDLRAERRVPRQLDREVPPAGVHDVERVVVDVGGLLGDVADHAAGRAANLPHRRRRAGDQDQEHPRSHRVGGQVGLGDAVLALPAAAVDDRDAVGLGEPAHPAAEPARHPHQMGVVQLLLGVVVQAPPPHPKPARVVPQREVGVEHDPVHAVVSAGQQLAVPLAQLIHGGRVPAARPRPGAAPSGATGSERRLGSGVGFLGGWMTDVDLGCG